MIPIAVLKTMAVQGRFDTSARAHFADVNLLGYACKALRVTWEPTSDPGSIRVTADAYGYNCYTGTLIKYDDADEELEFHRQLKAALGHPSTPPESKR